MFIFLLTSNYLRELQLDTEPIGWDGLRYRFQRDEKYHGVMLEMSAELTFIKRGGAYLREMYRLFGPEAVVGLSVYEVDANEFRPVRMYRGRVDFTTYSDSERGVSVNLKESTFATNLLNRNDQPIDLLSAQSLGGVAIPALPLSTAQMHSQQTLKRYEARQATTPTTFEELSGQDVVLVRIGFPDLDPPVNEFPALKGYGLYAGDFNSPANTPTFRMTEAGFYTIEFAFTHQADVELSTVGGFKVRLLYSLVIKRQGYPDDQRQISYYEEDFGAAAPGSLRQFSHRTTIPRTVIAENFAVGDSITLAAVLVVGDFDVIHSYVKWSSRYLAGAYFKMQAITTVAATQAVGPLVHEALEYCCAAMTDQARPFYSDYYGRTGLPTVYERDGPGSLRLITSGFALRGFPFTTAPAPAAGQVDTRKTITTTFNDLYDSCNAIDCLGLGIEQANGKQRVRVEPRAYFYQNAEVLRLGSVTGFTKAVRTNALHNAAEFGYQHWQSGTQNGLDEFNGRRTYTLPITAVKNTYAAVSSLNAAGYLIEQTRRDRYSDGTTKEGQADAENFVISLVRTEPRTEIINGIPVAFPAGYAAERNEAYQNVSGILSPSTTYNLRLSPGRMLQQHEPWLHTGLRQQAGKRITLTKVEGSAGLKSQFFGQTLLDESLPLQVADLAPAIVTEFNYEFTVRLRRWQMDALRANPYGRISFLDPANQRQSGYLLSAERTPTTGLTTFTLLPLAA